MRRAVILLAMVGASLGVQPASIEGTVVDQTSGKPLDRVHVRLMDSEVYGAMSDSSGHFSIAQMPPGRYMMAVERAGYVQSDGDQLILKDGQQVTDFKVKTLMARSKSTTGRLIIRAFQPPKARQGLPSLRGAK
jgi:hypothetical protein